MSIRLPRMTLAVFTLIAVAMIVGSTSVVSARPENTLDTPVTLWPTPSQGSDLQFWWSYKWTDGPMTFCTNNTTKNVAIVAQYLNDGAYNNDPSLLSFSFFKDDPCTYWWPNNNSLLRWYSKKMVSSNTTIYDSNPANLDNFADQFFSFRGYSSWSPYRGGTSVTGVADPSRTTTDLYNASNILTRRISGRYAVNIGGVFSYKDGFTYTYTSGDNAKVPNFFILPNRKIERDITLSRAPTPPYGPSTVQTDPEYWRYLSSDWNLQKSGAKPPFNQVYSNKSYVAWMRKTSVSWCEPGSSCKPVYYVAYSETDDSPSGPTGFGACEEWWYAQDIGPIYISTYGYPGDPNRPKSGIISRDECLNHIALNKTSPFGVRYIDYPDQYFTSGEGWLVGYLKQDARCIILGCRVDY